MTPINVIVPIGGIGQRFKESGYNVPKPLIRVMGKEMIFWVLDNLNLSKEDRVYIVYNEDLDKFNFSDRIKNKYNKIELVPLGFQTRGAAETVLCGINKAENFNYSLPTMTLDCDTFYREDIVEKFKEILGNCIFYFNDTNEKPIYSYIKTENDGKKERVLEIKEKEKISDNANVGCYCFRSGEILEKYCKHILDGFEKFNKEFYISKIYDKMLSDNIDISACEISDFVCLGTPSQLQVFALNFKEDDFSPKRICFDLDNTLVTYPKIEGDYTSVEPIRKNINMLRFLKEAGNTIIIYTARRMRTHQGNIGGVVADIGAITLKTLSKFDIPYDEIYFGKPYAHFYVDDLSVNPYFSTEKEIGFYNSEVKSRKFNTIEYLEDMVIKKSDKSYLDGEIYFYKNIPDEISNYFPNMINSSKGRIEIERINGVTYSSLYVNGSLTEKNLLSLLDAIEEIHSVETEDDVDIYLNYNRKIIERYKQYDYGVFNKPELVLGEIVNKLWDYEKNERGKRATIHGDPVFGNILIDSAGHIKFIDMRGMIGDKLSIAGDIFYDYAKIYQSIVGYDFYHQSEHIKKSFVEKFKNIFEEYIINKFGKEKMEEIKALTSGLLFSLIPLHNDKKCLQYFNLAKQLVEDRERYVPRAVEPFATLLFLEKIPQYDLFVDVGAGEGYYSFLSSKHMKKGKIIGYEPNPTLFKKINECKNIWSDEDVEIVFYEIGISNEVGALPIFLDGTGTMLPENTGKNKKDFIHKKRVDVTTLDKELENNKLKTLIKIDIEGLEVRALKGAEKLIGSKNKPDFLIEIHGDFIKNDGYDIQDIFDILKDYERVEIDHKENKDISYWFFTPKAI